MNSKLMWKSVSPLLFFKLYVSCSETSLLSPRYFLNTWISCSELLKTWHSLRSRTHFWNGGKMHNRKIFFCSWRWSRQTRSLMPCQLRIRKWSLKLVSEPDPGASLLAEIAKFVHVIMVKRSLSFYFFLFFQYNKFHLHVHCFCVLKKRQVNFAVLLFQFLWTQLETKFRMLHYYR